MDKNTSILKYFSNVLAPVKAKRFHFSLESNNQDHYSNPTVKRATVRKLEIIGEAIKNLLSVEPAKAICYARLLVDIGNKIVQFFESIYKYVVWNVIIKYIRVLQKEINIPITQISAQQ